MISNPMNWLVAQIKPNMLKKVIFNLKLQSFQYFAPEYEETIRNGNSFKKVKKLLFPGYIFIKVNLEQNNYQAVNFTSGISTIIKKSNGKPGVVSNKFIEELKKNVSNKTSSKNILQPGLKIKFIKGPFTGYIGKILTLEKDSRIRILFDLIENCRSVKCPKNFVTSVT